MTDPLEVNFTPQFETILNTIGTFKNQLNTLKTQVKTLERDVRKQMKMLMKKRRKNKGNRKPSGFAVPTKISDDLCDFMALPHGSSKARTEVTQYIIKYIKEKDLQWQPNRKIIKPDYSLKGLLDIKKGDELTYFNIQRYMNRHFVKE